MLAMKVGSEFLVNSETAGDQWSSSITGLINGGFVVSWYDHSGTLGDASGRSIKAQQYNALGTRVGGEFLVNTQTAGDQDNPTITSLANGGFVVTWYSFGTGNDNIKARIYDALGTPVGDEFVVNSQTASSQYSPTITALTSGGFVVTWYDYSGTLGDTSLTSIKAQIYDAFGARVDGEFLVNTQTTGDQYAPAITGLTNGGFVVTWVDNSGTLDNNIKAQVFSASGGKIGEEFVVNSQTTNSQSSPTITDLTNGGFVISWADLSGTLGDASILSIKGQAYDPLGARVGNEFLVNTETTNSQLMPAITGLSDGGFVVTWFDQSGALGDASGGSVKAQVYDALGVKVGDEFLVNTQTANSQNEPDITSLNGGGFVISWTDYSRTLGDTSAASIKAQIFGFDGVTITGTEANDAINTKKAPDGQPKATALDDVIFGNGGNDNIDGGAGADEMNGGTGNDTFTIDDAGDQAIELADGGIDTMKSGVVDLTLAAHIEKGTLLDVLGVGTDLDITGNDLANTLTGNRGANVLAGGEGKDVLNGKDGNDTLFGDAGDDKLNGNNGDDILIGGAGIDFLTGGAGSDMLTGGSEADQFKFDKFMLADGLLATDTITDFSGFGGEGDRINLGAIDANGTALDGNQKFAFIGTAAFGGVAGQLRYEQSGGDTWLSGDINGDTLADFQIIATGLHSLVAGDFIL